MGLKLDLANTLRIASEAGFTSVDLMVRDLLDAGQDPREVRLRMEDAGLRGGAFPLPVDWRGEADRFQVDLERLPRIAEAAATMGLAATCTWLLPELPEGASREATEEMQRHRVGAIARTLGAYGIRLGLEAIGVASFRSGRGEAFVTSLADVDRLFGPLRQEIPTLGLLVDAFHLYAADEPHAAAFAWRAERIAWVHVADLPAGAPIDRASIRDHERGLPGDHGAIDVSGLLAELRSRGYRGPVTCEPLAACAGLLGVEPRMAAMRVREAVEKVWPR